MKLFFYFYFFIFLKNNFFVFENVENLIADSKRPCPTYWGWVLPDSSLHIKWRPGGRLAPRLPSLITSKFYYVHLSYYHRRCISRSATRISKSEWPPIVQAETWWKKQKVPTLPQKSRKLKVVGKKWNSRRRLFNMSAIRVKKSRSNEGDFRCVPKKPITRKSVLWNFEI